LLYQNEFSYKVLDLLILQPYLLSMRLLIAFTLLCLGGEATFAQQVPYDSIKRVLDTVRAFDQGYRSIQNSILKEKKVDSVALARNSQLMNHYDSLNMTKVDAIINTYGWLGPDEVGDDGAETLFLVVQHADLAHQLKYLDLLKTAIQSGHAHKRWFPLMQDRILVAQGKLQIFGTQLGMQTDTKEWFIFPLADPENVDDRRHEYDLPPMQEYLDRYYLTWNPKQYKEQLPKLLEMLHGKMSGY
jgi:hypothetical protein